MVLALATMEVGPLDSKMRKLISLALLLSCLFLAGCSKGSEVQQAQPGDYDGPPGGAQAPKSPGS